MLKTQLANCHYTVANRGSICMGLGMYEGIEFIPDRMKLFYWSKINTKDVVDTQATVHY